MPTNLPNRASITYDGSGVILSNATNTTLLDQYTIELTKTAVNSETVAGGDVVYVLHLSNTGESALSSVSFTDDLGGGVMDYVENSAQFYLNGNPVTGTATPGSGDIVFDYNQSMESGDNLIVVYAASTIESQTGTITNTVTASGYDNVQPRIAVTATASETVTITNSANVSIFKSASQTTVSNGDALIYTFTIMNTGSEIAENISLVDELPAEFGVNTVSYTVDGAETPILPADYSITPPNTLTVPQEASSLELSVPAATSEGPGILVLTVTGTITA